MESTETAIPVTRLGLAYKAETTGFPDWKGRSNLPHQPHIVRLVAKLINLETREIVASMDEIVKPDGWTIPDVVIKVHGITNQHANENGISEKDALEQFLNLWYEAEVAIAHGKAFQSRIIRIATSRYGKEATQEAWKNGASYCTSTNAKKMGSDSARIDDAYVSLIGKVLKNKQDTMTSVNACAEIFFKIHDLSETQP